MRDSDLIGVPATVAAGVVFFLPVALFVVLIITWDPLPAVIVSAAFAAIVWGATLAFLRRTFGGEIDTSDLTLPNSETPKRVLVIGDKGLDRPEVASSLAGASQVRILAPVTSGSAVKRLADDVDTESQDAASRIEALVSELDGQGLNATGRVDEEGQPRRCLLDGLREFPAHEVVLAPAGEPGWNDAQALAKRLESEIGLRVVVLAP